MLELRIVSVGCCDSHAKFPLLFCQDNLNGWCRYDGQNNLPDGTVFSFYILSTTIFYPTQTLNAFGSDFHFADLVSSKPLDHRMPAPRIFMYCNSTRGMGRTARTLGIAASLSEALGQSSILVLTDLAMVGRFKLPERVDYVHLPALADSTTNSPKYGLRLERSNILRIRYKIATSTLKAFRPNLVWLDDSLLNLPEEMHNILLALAEELPETKILWGFSDTLGHPDFVLRQWAGMNAGEVFNRFADVIFILGTQRCFDAAKAYRMPEALAHKLFYTGYLSTREQPPKRIGEKLVKAGRRLPLVLLTTEGGREDFAFVDAYLRFLESTRMEVYSLIVAGLGLSSAAKSNLVRRAQALPRVIFKRFSKHLLSYVKAADAVICTGEYNLTSEVLAHRKAALLVPHASEQPDNFHRAQWLQERGLVCVSARESLQPETLEEFLAKSLFGGPRLVPKKQYEEISFDGFTQITESIQELLGYSRQFEAIAAS